ncbi:MAG: SDR family NAD(P)-dependent oxidoreductase [Gemmatimonadota bacterium]
MTSTAFITGASSGFGEGLARRYAARGYTVGLAARREDRLQALAGEIRSAGGRAVVCPCDVGDRGQVLAAVEHVRREAGEVDLLIANAGVDWAVYPEEFDGERVETMVRVNFLGAVYATEAVLPSMLERDRGQIVAMGSLAGYGGLPFTAGYSASKAALDKFFESLRIDLRHTGVDVTVLTPGYVKTPITEVNPYRMPFLMELDDALDRMERAIDRKGRRVGFPWPLWIQAFLGQVFPRWLYDRVAGAQDRDKRPH